MPEEAAREVPKVLLAALRGGSGKTVLSVGIITALCKAGKRVVPFKKGPDYIDAGWLAMAAGRPCYNLDTFLADEPLVRRSFLSHVSAPDVDLAFIEGNRGLYDGLDVDGTTSTASLARLLNAPVLLCLDCTKSTRTMAAVVLGCLQFEADIRIGGVILNRVAGSRHESIIRQSIEKYCGVPVIGAVPKLGHQDFPERHMGLIPTAEHAQVAQSIRRAADTVAKYIQMDDVLRIAGFETKNPLRSQAETDRLWDAGGMGYLTRKAVPEGMHPVIGIFRDSAFQFYYPDNIEALKRAGARLVEISPLRDTALPEIHGLYIGGGFPETHAAQLAANEKFRYEVRVAAESGLPIYAECGGLMYLGESLRLEKSYAMAGVLPIVFGFSKKPQGHGYTIARVDQPNPFYETGTLIKGHEFHYSKVLEWRGEDREMAFSMEKGRGIRNGRDGITYKNVFATYTHIHSLGMPQWAETMVRLAGTRNGI